MNILQRYVAKSYISAFFLGMVVLTFVLSIGLLVKATQLVIKGLDPKLILNFLLVSIPESFSFTIPLAVLVSALLVLTSAFAFKRDKIDRADGTIFLLVFAAYYVYLFMNL